MVGFQTLGWRGRYEGVNLIERAIAVLERRKKRGRLVLVEQRVPLQRQMAPKGRGSETERGMKEEGKRQRKEEERGRKKNAFRLFSLPSLSISLSL